MAPDLAKYVSGDDPCPFCEAEFAIDSTDEDTFIRDGQTITVEKWSCGECGAQWDAVFTFTRLEIVREPETDA